MVSRTENTEEIIIFQRNDASDEIYRAFEKGYHSGSIFTVHLTDHLKDRRLDEGTYITLLFYEKRETHELFLAESEVLGEAMHILVKQRISHTDIVQNIRLCLELHGFKQERDCYTERSRDVLGYLKVLLKRPYEYTEFQKESYQPMKAEEHQHPLSQKNEYCRRVYAQTSIGGRGEFQRDYDRIIHSKAFRRLVDKAQIFSAAKGDYYRTRMTHTLTVVQIAKGISNPLGLNLYLTEAIAMGHDLGHTPFGHQGERTLDSILKGEIGLLPEDECKKNFYGGFKHNYQTLREVSKLEESYIKYNGLNLSFQALEGMWKHTKIKSDICLGEFFPGSFSEYLYPELSFSTTLEGQVAAIADEIAQRSHDLDDAFAAGLITLDDLEHYLELNEMQDLLKILLENREEYQEYLDRNRMFGNQKEILINRAVSEVIRYFIEDVIKASTERMASYKQEQFQKDGCRVREKLIGLSDKGEALCDYLEKIISKKVINCSEVALFDSKASRIVEGLFRAYYKNPGLLHEGTIMRIYRDFREESVHVFDFRNSDPKLVKREWRKITCQEEAAEGEKAEYAKKRKMLVRNICDFIAGMTDSYAQKEYEKIYR